MNHTHIRRQRKNIEKRHEKFEEEIRRRTAIKFIQDFQLHSINYDKEMRTNNK